MIAQPVSERNELTQVVLRFFANGRANERFEIRNFREKKILSCKIVFQVQTIFLQYFLFETLHRKKIS